MPTRGNDCTQNNTSSSQLPPSSSSYHTPSDNLHLIVLIRPERKSFSIPFARATSWDRLVYTLYKLYIGHCIQRPHPSLVKAFSCIRAFYVDSGAEILPEFWNELLRPAMSIEVEFLSPFLSPPWDCNKFNLFHDDDDIVMTSSLTGDTQGLIEYPERIQDITNMVMNNSGNGVEKGLLTPGSPSARSSVSTQPGFITIEDKLSGNICTSSFGSGKTAAWPQQMAVDANGCESTAMISSEIFRSGYSFRDSVAPSSVFGGDISTSASHTPSLVSSPMQPSAPSLLASKGIAYSSSFTHLSNGTVQNLIPKTQTPPPSPFVGSTRTIRPDEYFTHGSPGTSNRTSSTKRKRTWSEATTPSANERPIAPPRPSSNGRMVTRQSSGSNSSNGRGLEEESQSPKRPRFSPNSKSANTPHKRQSSNEKKYINNNNVAHTDEDQGNKNGAQPPTPQGSSSSTQESGVVIERALLLDTLCAGEFIKIIRAKDGSLIALREDEDYEVVMERRKSETKAMSDLNKERELKAAMDSHKKRKRGAEDDVNDLIRIWSGGGAEKKRKAVVFDKLAAEEKIMLQKLVREHFIIRIDHFTAPVIDGWKEKNLPNADHEQITGYIVDVANTVYNTELKRKSAYRSFLELHGLS